MEKIKKIFNHKNIFILILIIAIFLRIYKIIEIPTGIHVDEAGMFVDAQYLNEFKTDRYMNKLPIYLTNFGGGQSILYAYITSFLLKMLPNNYILIKIPGIIFGIMVVILSYLISKETINKKYALVTMLFTALCPYFIMSSRIGLDCNLYLGIFMLLIYTLILASKKKSKAIYLIAGIIAGISLYTYILSIIITTLFLIMHVLYMLNHNKIKIKEIIFLTLPYLIIAIPILIFILVNMNIIGECKYLVFSIKKLPIFRSGEIGFHFENILSIVTLLSYDYLDSNSIIYFGTVYYIFIVFLIIGIFIKTKEFIHIKKFNIDTIILFNFISCYICMIFIEDPNINKANNIYFAVVYFIIIGILYVTKKYKYALKWIIITLIINNIIFDIYYFKYYKTNNNYFDNTVYKIVSENKKTFEKRKIRILSNLQEESIYIKLSNINILDNQIINDDNLEIDCIYIVEKNKYKNTMTFKNIIDYNDYYLLYN